MLPSREYACLIEIAIRVIFCQDRLRWPANRGIFVRAQQRTKRPGFLCMKRFFESWQEAV